MAKVWCSDMHSTLGRKARSDEGEVNTCVPKGPPPLFAFAKSDQTETRNVGGLAERMKPGGVASAELYQSA